MAKNARGLFFDLKRCEVQTFACVAQEKLGARGSSGNG